jgi:hypothetical protein
MVVSSPNEFFGVAPGNCTVQRQVDFQAKTRSDLPKTTGNLRDSGALPCVTADEAALRQGDS